MAICALPQIMTKHRTVFSGSKPSPATIRVRQFYNMIPYDKVLDFGAGLGRNSKYLSNEMRFDVFAYDPNLADESELLYPITDNYDKIKDTHYQLVVCNYVLNVVSVEEQREILKQLDDLVWDYLMIELRPYQDIMKNAKKNEWKLLDHTPFGIRFRTQSGTTQMGYTDNVVQFIEQYISCKNVSIRRKSPSLMIELRRK